MVAMSSQQTSRVKYLLSPGEPIALMQIEGSDYANLGNQFLEDG